ncbi:MAG: lysine 2,3-aminomutase [Syntrophus sp. (in: bacteria)]|nr:lysine 2,3-aminomutase [Syntrophus sp. (in: bacteria)]
MGRKNLSIQGTTKQHGRRTEEPSSFYRSKLSTSEEGISNTLPFFLHSLEALSRHIPFDSKTERILKEVVHFHRMKVPLFYLNLMDGNNPSCPIRQQAVPSPLEMDNDGEEDPLGENGVSVTPALLKRHLNRGVFLVTSQCAMYCRFCNRKRLVGKAWHPEIYREESIRYIKEDPHIREIILSGGDPFMLAPDELGYILSELRGMPKIGIIRISTRMPVVWPEGFTREHLKEIKKYAPLWIVIHINHPKEISPEFLELVRKIRETGNMLISQTVLLRNINDCPHVLSKLFHMLVAAGIKPYYLFQLDEVIGAAHFKVRLEKGIEIMRALRENASGLAMPQYALDITGGLGKIPLDYVYVKGRDKGSRVHVENPSGKAGIYCDDGEESSCMNCGICRK